MKAKGIHSKVADTQKVKIQMTFHPKGAKVTALMGGVTKIRWTREIPQMWTVIRDMEVRRLTTKVKGMLKVTVIPVMIMGVKVSVTKDTTVRLMMFL